MKNALLSLVAIALMSLSSCASVGRPFDLTHVNDIEVGVQTKAEIQEWFGEPNTIQTFAETPTGAAERWMYTYAHSKASISTTSHSLVVDFNATDVVCDQAYATTP